MFTNRHSMARCLWETTSITSSQDAVSRWVSRLSDRLQLPCHSVHISVWSVLISIQLFQSKTSKSIANSTRSPNKSNERLCYTMKLTACLHRTISIVIRHIDEQLSRRRTNPVAWLSSILQHKNGDVLLPYGSRFILKYMVQWYCTSNKGDFTACHHLLAKAHMTFLSCAAMYFT